MTGDPQTNTWLALAGGGNHPLGPRTHSIGRSSSNEIVIPDHKVSRAHAIIHCQNFSEFVLVDLGSANGSHANGRRISGPTCLKDGDRLKFGDTECVFRQGRSTALRASASGNLEQQTLKDHTEANRWLLIADIRGATARLQNEPVQDLSIHWGQWFSNSKTLIEEYGGSINSFLGDGFIATWLNGSPGVAQRVATLLALMKASQTRNTPSFRLVIHYGSVLCGSVPGGGEGLIGKEMNYVFRMERLAARLDVERLASRAAMEQLAPHLELTSLKEEHPLTGFTGMFTFFTF